MNSDTLIDSELEQGSMFNIRTGYCHVLEDKLVVRYGRTWRGKIIANVPLVARVILSWMFTILMIGYLSLASYNSYLEENWGEFVWTSFLVVYLLYSVFRSFGFSVQEVIYRSDIYRVEVKGNTEGSTRKYFIVHFKDSKGRKKKRLLSMSRYTDKSDQDFADAMQILEQEGLLKR